MLLSTPLLLLFLLESIPLPRPPPPMAKLLLSSFSFMKDGRHIRLRFNRTKYLHNTARALRPIIQPWKNASSCFLKASLTACKYHQINLSPTLHSTLYTSCVHFSCNLATKRNNRLCKCTLSSPASESRAGLSLASFEEVLCNISIALSRV